MGGATHLVVLFLERCAISELSSAWSISDLHTQEISILTMALFDKIVVCEESYNYNVVGWLSGYLKFPVYFDFRRLFFLIAIKYISAFLKVAFLMVGVL